MSAHNVPASEGHDERLIAEYALDADGFPEDESGGGHGSAGRTAWREYQESLGPVRRPEADYDRLAECRTDVWNALAPLVREYGTVRLKTILNEWMGRKMPELIDGQVAPEGPHTSS